MRMAFDEAWEASLDVTVALAFDEIENDAERAAEVEVVEASFVSLERGVLFSLAGAMAWFSRLGAILSGVFATLPAWMRFDPLPIFSRLEDEDENEASEDQIRYEDALDPIFDEAPEEAGKSPREEEPSLRPSLPSSGSASGSYR